MYSKVTVVKNQSGLHARPAAEFVKLASKFKSQIHIKKNIENAPLANAKSVIFLLSLGLTSGTEVLISAEGIDEIEAVDALVDLIDNQLND